MLEIDDDKIVCQNCLEEHFKNVIHVCKYPQIDFRIDDEVILILNKKGFVYKKQIIEDAGVAYDLFINFLRKLKLNGEIR